MNQEDTVYQVMAAENSYTEPTATCFVFSTEENAQRMVDRLMRYRDVEKDENPKDPYTYYIDDYTVDGSMDILELPIDRCLFFVWFTPDGVTAHSEPTSIRSSATALLLDEVRNGVHKVRIHVWASSHADAIDKAREIYRPWMLQYREAWV